MSIYDYTEGKTDNSHIDIEDDSFWDKIRHKYYSIIPYNWRPHEIWYKFRAWAWYRYTTYKPRYLSHRWCDRTEVLLHMNFEILCEFIEKECSPGIVEWYGDSPHMIEVNGVQKNVMDEMKELYNWWIDCHTDRIDEDRLLDKQFSELHKILDELCKEFGGVTRSIPEIRGSMKVYVWKSEHKDEEKYRDYVFARANLDTIHEEFLNNQIKRIIDLREWMWT